MTKRGEPLPINQALESADEPSSDWTSAHGWRLSSSA